MMKRRSLFALLALPGALPTAFAQAPGAWLVTPEEAVRFGGAEGFAAPLPLTARAVTPAIEVLQPSVANQQKLKTPFPIAVRFRPADAPIVPASFKVLYGALRFDITDRVVKYVKPTPEGFTFDQAQIPSGKHRLILSVADEKQRVAESDLRIEVE